MDLASGAMLGQYRLVKEAGAGGMAEVWEAVQPSLDRRVAIKVLPRHLARQPGFLERFRQEARAISRLDHPNILSIHDFGEIDGCPYMVMPFLSGGTLAQKLGRPWSLESIVETLRPLAAALDYAHSRGIIHRDVKPQNILISESGRLVLADFGIARMAEGAGPAVVTSAGMGTPAYMSPEQIEGLTVTPATDQYSLGVMAYELLSGRRPFDADTPNAVARAHVTRQPPPPRTLNPSIASGAEQAVLRALAKRPEHRFPTVSALVDALATIEPPQHPSPSSGEAVTVPLAPPPAPRFAPRTKPLASPGGAPPQVPLVPISVAQANAPRVLPLAPVSATPTPIAAPGSAGSKTAAPNRRRGMWVGILVALGVVLGGLLLWAMVNVSIRPSPESARRDPAAPATNANGSVLVAPTQAPAPAAAPTTVIATVAPTGAPTSATPSLGTGGLPNVPGVSGAVDAVATRVGGGAITSFLTPGPAASSTPTPAPTSTPTTTGSTQPGAAASATPSSSSAISSEPAPNAAPPEEPAPSSAPTEEQVPEPTPTQRVIRGIPAPAGIPVPPPQQKPQQPQQPPRGR